MRRELSSLLRHDLCVEDEEEKFDSMMSGSHMLLPANLDHLSGAVNT